MLSQSNNAKVVLFGAGSDAQDTLKNLISDGVIPAYFVYNNRSIISEKTKCRKEKLTLHWM